MRDGLDMSYRKVVKIPINANSDRCLIQRMQCGMKFLALTKSTRRIISMDESWLNMTDHRRRKWQMKGLSNSIPTLQVHPRVSILAAIDNFGAIYVSLSQANTSS